MGSVTFNGIDFLDSRSVEHAAGLLWAVHRNAKISVELLRQKEQEVRDTVNNRDRTFSMDFITLDEVLLEPETGKEILHQTPTRMIPQGYYRGNSKELVETMCEKIQKHGSVTLEETAEVMGITVDTARAFLRNAGRTNRAHGTEFPFAPQWDSLKRCNDYVFRDADDRGAKN